MLQHAVALLLQRLLGKFVSFDSSMLRLSLWQGDLAFQDLQLRLSYGEGSIGKLSVKIPWRALWTQPVIIRASRIRILLHQTSTSTAANGGPASSLYQSDDASSESASNDIIDGPTDRTYLSRLVSHIIANVQIELTDVQVRYDCSDSSSPQNRSATLDVNSMKIINASSDWELTFTPQSNSLMESRKLLTTEGISAYVECCDSSGTDSASPRSRRYIFHDWYTTAKTTLCYNSSNAMFPDVEVQASVGCRVPIESITPCAYCDGKDSTIVGKLLAYDTAKPTLHLGHEHIDVLYAILMEVQAPYEEFERLAEFTQKQRSRQDGFLTVLSYARQWLLSDCFDGIAPEVTGGSSVTDDYDDDDDDFEDAITPPSLKLRGELADGVKFVVISREFSGSDDDRIWVWSVGTTKASIKQSCVEDEIHLQIGSCKFSEVGNQEASNYDLFSHRREGEPSGAMFIEFSSIVPAYESRLVGHQPSIKLKVHEDSSMLVKDESLVKMMTLLSPVYYWWKQWNQAHPKKAMAVANDTIAPISWVSVSVREVSVTFRLDDRRLFGVALGGIDATTTETKDGVAESTCVVLCPRVFSEIKLSSSDSKTVKHDIISMDRLVINRGSRSRFTWAEVSYDCLHEDGAHGFNEREQAMYWYDVRLPEIAVHLHLSELEALSWIQGKWSFFLATPSTSPTQEPSLHLSVPRRPKCVSKTTISSPRISCSIQSDHLDQKNSLFTLIVEGLSTTSSLCSRANQLQVRLASVSLCHGTHKLVEASGNPRGVPFGAVFERVNHAEDSCDMKVGFHQLEVALYLESLQVLLRWLTLCSDAFALGFILATSCGYNFSQLKDNLQLVHEHSMRIAPRKLSRVQVAVHRTLRIVVLHRETNERFSPSAAELVSIESSGVAISLSDESGFNVKGSFKNFQVTDLTFPRAYPKGYDTMPNRHFISSIPVAGPDGSVDTSVRNSVDFTVSTDSNGGGVVRVRLDSVNAVYLHRMYKQVHHYIADHLALFDIKFQSLSLEATTRLVESFAVDLTNLPVSLDEILRLYREAVTWPASSPAVDFTKMEYELVANDIVFSLPRNSFSDEQIVLRSTNARLWSSQVDPDQSSFLQTGALDFDQRGSTISAAEAFQSKTRVSRRLELRNLRRLVKNQRSRMLSNRSQLFVDLKNATQQAQNYLHEGFEALPAAEEAVKIIHAKIMSLEQELDRLNQHLKEVEEAIDAAKAEVEGSSGGRDSMFVTVVSPIAQNNKEFAETGRMIERVKAEVMGMSQHLLAPIFGADDAEFHDARTIHGRDSNALEEDVADEQHLFDFEIVDMSGFTTNSSSPLFHHALLTGRIDVVPEKLSSGAPSSYFALNLGLNELSIGAQLDQYTTLLGVIFENFKEESSVINEDTYPLCTQCCGHHYDDMECYSVWLTIPVRVADGALRIFNDESPIADLLLEQLELTFTLRTDDSLEVSASSTSVTAMDMRPGRNEGALDVIRPVAGEGMQVVYNQWQNWTESRYTIQLNNTSCLLVYPIVSEVVSFFVDPVLKDEGFMDFGVGFICAPFPEWTKMDIGFTSKGCTFSLLEDFEKPDTHALVLLSTIDVGYTVTQKSANSTDLKKCHVSLDQRGVYFSQLPDLQIDVSFPLANPFLLVFDHLIEGTARMSRRNSFVLAPVEARFSVQDGLLFIQIIDNYLKAVSSSLASAVAHASEDTTTTRQSNTGWALADEAKEESASKSSLVSAPPFSQVFAVDKLLGDVGELRFVLVNNSLGIPVADFQISEIVCEYIQDEEYSVVVGAILALNYFNNSIYRWEPLVEPFVLQVRMHRNLEENSKVEVFANLLNTVNLNLTPAMAPLLSMDMLKQADFVTSSSKSTAPFWIVNKTGTDIKFSFRRGRGNVIQQHVPDEVKVAVDCREQGDMRSFDSASSDRFLLASDRHALTVNHTLSVWLNGSKWVSANPVVVDVVGHISVPLREASAVGVVDDSSLDDDYSPPILVAEITIEPDGSKLISLHSQVVLQNRTSIPLMVWAFSPRDGGTVHEWTVDREQVCYVPLQLIHPQSKISIRPSPYVQYAPLATTLEELGDEVQASKAKNAKRFVRSGQCVCNFEAFLGQERESVQPTTTQEAAGWNVSTLMGYVVQDLPTWKCTYDVEAYFLMRATFAGIDDPIAAEPGRGGQMSAVDEDAEDADEINSKVEEDFLNVFAGGRANKRRMQHPLSEVNNELEEARTANQRRGLYEATNSSLYHLSISPFVTLHNRLAAPVAYRLLNQSLQLIGEGVLAVGSVLPLFQMDPAAALFVSFRLENYNWSAPKTIINPKQPSHSLPYKDIVEPIELLGRVFNRGVPGQQDDVPNLQLQVKLTGRDVIVFCSVWIVNHSGLDLEYCNSTSTSSRRLETVLRYVHKRRCADGDQTSEFSTRTLSFNDDMHRDLTLTRLQKLKAASNPVAVVVVLQEAKNLYNSQYFGAQSPYVRVSLYIVKNVQDRFLEKPEMIVFCSGTTKPCPSGGVNPAWDTKLQNTLLLRLPDNPMLLQKARVILEVRNVRYGMDTCLGVTAIKLETILNNRDHAAGFNWYKLLKRKSTKEKKKDDAASAKQSSNVHRGDVRVSFAVGTKQELQSEFDTILETPKSQRSDVGDDDALSPAFEEEFDDTLASAETSGAFLPTSAAVRSMQRLQTPSNLTLLHTGVLSGASLVNDTTVPSSRRARQGFVMPEVESTRSQADMLYLDAASTRSTMSRVPNGSPPKASGRIYPIQVYLPQNRFASVVVHVTSSALMSEIFEAVCAACGFRGLLDAEDFDFYEMLLPRFVSLRSAGRPEGERWYGSRLSMDSRIERRGRRFGLHLCHKLAMSTIRLYDESSTASSHHMTPRSLLTTSQKVNPAQKRPVAWGDVLLYGSGGRNWDVLRVRTSSSPWSEVLRLNRNAMGNAGVAQVITLNNNTADEVESDQLKGSQEIALWSTFGSGRFSETIVATIVPRYILINRTSETIKYRQLNVPQTFQLSPNDLVPFHWPSSSKDKLLEVTLLHRFLWSGSFRIYSLGTTYLKLRSSDDASKIYILQCQIEMVGGSIALVFREESRRFPPYRIDNMTSFRIQYKQSSWGDESDYDELPPRASCPYSWDLLTGNEKYSTSAVSEPTFSSTSSAALRTLQVRFMRITSATGDGTSDNAAAETREYHLDEMASHRRIQLQRSLPSQLFVKPDHKGYLHRKDNLLKWNKKYFRLYEHMLFYFASEEDQELLGVIDLRSGSDVPGSGGVAIFEKPVESSAAKSGFISLNGFVSSISGTLFGSSSRQAQKDDGADPSMSDDDDEERTSALVHLAVLMTSTGSMCEASEKFSLQLAESGDPKKIALARKGFFVNGHDVVDFLVLDRHVSSETEALAMANELLQLKVLHPVSELKSSRFQYSKIAWYTVDSITLAEDSDSMESSEDGTPHSTIATPVSARARAQKPIPPKAAPRSNQFSIITTTKFYDLKAKSAKEAGLWVKKLRRAARGARQENNDGDATERSRSQRGDQALGVQTVKTYVHVRIRADGPTKVLELYEGGEEEADDREAKHDLSSLASVSSGSPTASETSTNAFDAITNGMSLHLRVDGFGISCVNEIPMELIYIYMGGMNLHYSRVNSKMKLKFTLDDIQVDNQTSDATFIKLLCPRMEASADTGENGRPVLEDEESFALADSISDAFGDEMSTRSTGLVANSNIFSCADCKYRQANIASMHFCCTWSNEQGTTDYFEHCSLWMYPVIMQVDEELLIAARAFIDAMTRSWGRQQTQNRGGEIRMKSIPIEIMTEAVAEFQENTEALDLNPLKSLVASTASSAAEVRKVYFALLHIHPIELDITYRSDVFQATTTIRLREAAASFKASTRHIDDPRRTASMPASSSSMALFEFDGGAAANGGDDDKSSSWAIPSLAMHVPDLDNAPVRLNALMIEHAFGTSGDLTRRVTKYYTRQMWKQLHKILGSFDFLGNPVGFLDHIGTGVRDFVYEPLEGLKVGGKGFSKGLAKGTASLVSNTLDGTFDAASKISGTFGQGLANLSLDDHYQKIRARARRHHVRGIRDGLVQGSKELSLGVYEGVAGLVLNPMRGAHENGALGFAKGTITGIIGLPLKPVAGIFDFASRASQGVRNRSRKYGKTNRRVRRPRVFGRYNELKCYKEADTIAYDLLKKTGGTKMSGEKIVFYNEVLQSVAGSELTKEARERRKNDSLRERSASFKRTLQEHEDKESSGSDSSRRKLVYEVTFYQKKLGLELETDFYCENVSIKSFEEGSRHQTTVETPLAPDQEVLQAGDILLRVGGVDVRGIGFHETLAMLRGTARPIRLQFESAEEHVAGPARSTKAKLSTPKMVSRVEDQAAKLRVQLTHWIIVTEERALYINVGSLSTPVVEWVTPLRYVYKVEWVRGIKICLHLSVGVDSLPTGPRLRPSLKALDGHERDMNVFLDVMWLSFGSTTAEEQELWPSDTSLNGYLLKKGGFSTVKRWFVLSRNCLYYFSSRKELRGIIPLGSVRLQADSGESLSIRITNVVANEPLVTLQMDNGQVIERAQSEIVLIAPNAQEFEMWQSSLAHAAGRGLRHSRGTRFFVPNESSRLEIGCRDTPDFVVAPLVEALRRAVEVFNTKLTS